MRSVALIAAFATLGLCAPVWAQSHAFVPEIGARVTPKGAVPLYTASPSRLVGNTFNKPVGETAPQGHYTVSASKALPGLDGNQIWIQITPVYGTDAAACPASGCWSYFGTDAGDKMGASKANFIPAS